MDKQIYVRAAESGDASDIGRLITELGYPTSGTEMEARLAILLPHPDHITNVALTDDRIVGVVGAGIAHYYEKNGRYARILALVVDGKYRGHGIGSMLVRETEWQLQERGVGAVIVNSGSHRKEAHGFYASLGYAETGVRFVKSL